MELARCTHTLFQNIDSAYDIISSFSCNAYQGAIPAAPPGTSTFAIAGWSRTEGRASWMVPWCVTWATYLSEPRITSPKRSDAKLHADRYLVKCANLQIKDFSFMIIYAGCCFFLPRLLATSSSNSQHHTSDRNHIGNPQKADCLLPVASPINTAQRVVSLHQAFFGL